jgi:cytochrome c biogenesis protein CcdA
MISLSKENIHYLVYCFFVALILSLLLPSAFVQGAEDNTINVLYFYSYDCNHCQAVKDELLTPMEQEYGARLNILYVEISTAKNYELLIEIEKKYTVPAVERAIPTLVIGNVILIGEDEIRNQFPTLVAESIETGTPWPDLPGFVADDYKADLFTGIGSGLFDDEAACDIEDEVCEVESPIHIAYFYQTGCKVCSRVEADLTYMQTLYPQIIIDEFNIYDHVNLGQWLATQAGRTGNIATPAIFIADTMLVGEEEITPDSIEALVNTNLDGAEAIWANFTEDTDSATGLFENLSWLTIAFAGLIDGLNPCAFATLIFFVSYLSISQRRGREILYCGIAFTAGVFLAYLVVGLGFYQVLDLLGGMLQFLSNLVYGITAMACLILAVLSIRDAIKIHNGGTAEMGLHLPDKLRKRINTRIRAGRKASAYVWFAFVTGLIISMLELACTGQIYLPTIIFMTSQESMQVQAIFYLLLYNLMFIVPLIIVFILTFYGTNSKDLTNFLEKHAMKIKIGMGILFSALSIWLILSIFK